MATYGWWSDQGQILAHFTDHLKSMVTCNWTPVEEGVTNTMRDRFWLAAKIWSIQKTTPRAKLMNTS